MRSTGRPNATASGLMREPVERPSEADLVEQILQYDREMPHEVAVYLARRSVENLGDRDEWLAFRFAGLDSAAQALPLSPLELTARHLEAQDPRYQYARSIEQARPHHVGVLRERYL